MEKYARQALSEGIKNPDDLRIALDSELYRVLNLHYNRNNHIEVRIRNEQVPGYFTLGRHSAYFISIFPSCSVTFNPAKGSQQ